MVSLFCNSCAKAFEKEVKHGLGGILPTGNERLGMLREGGLQRRFGKKRTDRCEECGGLVEGRALEIGQKEDSQAIWAHNPPKKCTRCKAEMGRWGASEPLLDGALELYVKSIELGGCPKCGSKNIVRGMCCWD